jgi:hypothetical protein
MFDMAFIKFMLAALAALIAYNMFVKGLIGA